MTEVRLAPTVRDMGAIAASLGRRRLRRRLDPGGAAAAAPDVVDLARVLLLLQGAFAVLSAMEVGFFGLLTGAPALLMSSMAATGGMAFLILALAAGLGRRSRLARRLTLVIEAFILLGAAVDLGLSLALAHAFLDPVPTLTRLVIPVAVVVLLRKASARAAFPARGMTRRRAMP